MPDTRLFHIADVGAWVAAGTAGVYSGASLDTDGFIHLSTESQWLRVANTFYRGKPGLVLLEIDPTLIGDADLRYEDVDGEAFPHLYGALNVDAVVAVHDLVVGDDGVHLVPLGVKGVAGPPAP